MLDANQAIIYIGKANNIRQRVSQYFTRSRSYKTSALVQHIHAIIPIITANEHDALLLENRLIKQHQPRFNVLLKDDKTYPYIKITVQDPFPRIIITRKNRPMGRVILAPTRHMGPPNASDESCMTPSPFEIAH